MSNRSDILKILIEIDTVETALRTIERSVSSIAAETCVSGARHHLAVAKLELAGALRCSVDPILDLTFGVAA